MNDFRLARVNPSGEGAAARFMVEAPFTRQWVDLRIASADRPRRLVEAGRVGRIGRSRFGATYDFIPEGENATRVELTLWTEPGTRLDAFKESLGARRWLRRQSRMALERLRAIFEDPPAAPLARADIAGYEPLTHARFGA